MQRIVDPGTFDASIAEICDSERIAIDTETTGLYPFHGDRLFAVVVATKTSAFYFDFNINGKLSRRYLPRLQEIIDRVRYIKFVNYTFDMVMLHFEGIRFPPSMRILDAGVAARVHYNLHTPVRGSEEGNFSLDYLAKFYLNLSKSDEVKKYCQENGLYKIDAMGDRAPDFQRVPLEIMSRYAMLDARLTYDIVETIITKINALDVELAEERPPGTPPLMSILARESKLSYELFHAYLKGFRCDTDYVKRAIVHEKTQIERFEAHIKQNTPPGFNYQSSDQLGKFLVSKGVDLPMTAPTKKTKNVAAFKPKPKTDAKTLEIALEGIDLPVVKSIREAKKAQKRVSTYYENYLKMVDANGVIHGNINQQTTKTGRTSSSEPNLQNLGKDKVWHEWAVRNSFIAFEDYYLACLDYDQQEMKVVADRAQEQTVISKINAGLDFYDATGEVMRELLGQTFERPTTKAVSLGVTYGQGKDLLARNLKTSPEQAARFKLQFLSAMPAVKYMNEALMARAKRFGRIFTPYGRVLYIDPGFEYKALNAYVQGTSADMTKESLVRSGELFRRLRAQSLITCTVHDENIYSLHRHERELLPEIAACMTGAYEPLSLPMTVGIDLTRTSWAKKQDVAAFNDFYLD